MDSRSLFQNIIYEVNEMESTGRRALKHPPSTNMRYIATLDNLEEHEQDVHKLITIISRVTNMHRQYH